MYNFETHFGKSTLVDDETGIVIEWENGKFNTSQTVKTDQSVIAIAVPEEEDLASFLARKMREMCEYVAKNFPELV